MNGNPLPQPVDTAMPTFAAPNKSDTAVPGFAPFGGTSAAAPNAAATAALVLQANSFLTTIQLTAVLAQSAIPTASPPGVNDSGAGLIQARAAVEIAVADAGVRWSSPGGGTWADGASWSTGIVPISDQAVILGDNLGALTVGYTVHLASGLATAAALAITGVGTNTVTLALSGGSLTVAGAGSSVITKNDFLVGRGGSLSITGGTLTTAGTLNVNAGAVSLAGGDASARAFAQDAGSLTIGGNPLAAATLNLQAVNPGEATFGQTGGLVHIANHGTVSIGSGSVSGGTLDVASDGSVSATGSLTVFNSALVNNAGAMSAAGLLSVIDSGRLTTSGTMAVGRLISGGSTARHATRGTADCRDPRRAGWYGRRRHRREHRHQFHRECWRRRVIDVWHVHRVRNDEHRGRHCFAHQCRNGDDRANRARLRYDHCHSKHTRHRQSDRCQAQCFSDDDHRQYDPERRLSDRG